MKEGDRYLKLVEWSEEDQCYIGSVPGWIGRCCHGDDEKKVFQELCQIIDEWIEIYKKENLPLPKATCNEPRNSENGNCLINKGYNLCQ